MSLELEGFSKLLGLLYEALVRPERFQEFLAEVSRLIACDKATITFHDEKNRSPATRFFWGLRRDAMREYDAYWATKNPVWTTRNPVAVPILKQALQSGFWHGFARSVVREAAYEKSDYYNGWGRRYGVYHVALGVASNDGHGVTALSLMRPKSAGALDQGALDLMRLLIPHFKRAFEVYQKLEALRASSEAANVALDRLEAACISVAADGRVVSMNGNAEAIVENHSGITVRQGKLAATESSESTRLEHLIASAAQTGAGSGTSAGDAMKLHGSETSEPLAVTTVPFCSSYLPGKERPCALVFLTDPAAKPKSRAANLSMLFGLTPAECRLADLLAEGLELRNCAECMHITVGTARFMLKSIFHKTETHRQSQLIRLLMGMPGQPQ